MKFESLQLKVMKTIIHSAILIIFLIGSTTAELKAQSMSRQEFKDTIHTMPAFSIYHDNYFISGVPTNNTITKDNSDIKYQVSFKQMITRATLPLNSYLFVSYTQKAFWDIYKKSSPFAETNFNPAIGLAKPVFNKNDKIVGLAEFKMEHESNGRDSLDSRSWNRFTLGYSTPVGTNGMLTVKGWLPFAYKDSNPDILDYVGLGEVKMEYNIITDILSTDVTVRKGLKDWNGAISARLLYKLFNNSNNQYLMLEWFAGHSESLIDYQKYTSMVRIGYVIKSSDLNVLKDKPKN